jgi:hypothetical protein
MAATTDFPIRPRDVAPLTIAEFTEHVDLDAPVSFDFVCGRFPDDANRALVWVIRFRALNAWRERRDVALWLGSDASLAQRASQLAASFALDDAWEFPADAFRLAVESLRR